jgi:hypothetical protein
MAMPFQEAASKTVTPGGTRTEVPEGTKCRLTRVGSSTTGWCSLGSSCATTVTVRP